jgi:putative ABC transport system permease protein
MFKNYIKIAWRNVTKNKLVFLINIIGLSIGLTACLLMFIYIKSELSYDKFQNKGDRIARVIMEYSFGDGTFNKGNYTSARVLPVFKNEFPEVESGTRVFNQTILIYAKENTYEEDNFVFVDSSFFNVLSGFKLIEGNPNDVLNGTNKIVLTRSSAKKYFGNENPIGKTLKLGIAQTEYEVTGISEDCPQNSQVKYNVLASFQNMKNAREDTYWNANYTTYLLLKQPGGLAALQDKINRFMVQETKEMQNVTIRYELEPFLDIHLHSPYPGIEANSNIKYIYITAGIAILMLIIASSTYINLSTVRSMERAKEVGIRKVAGATKQQVFWQFIAESFLLSCLALIASIGLTMLTLPSFNYLAGIQISLLEALNPATILAGILIIVTITLLAGIYPAMVLANFLPVRILKGAYKNTRSGMTLRKGLTTFQFTISAFLICATVIMYQQLNYIQNKEMGYNKEQILVLPSDNTINNKLGVLKTELKKNNNIQYVSATVNTPINIVGGYNIQRRRDLDEQISVTATPIDEEFLQASGLTLVAGENLTLQDIDAVNKNEEEAFYNFILNESAAQKLGWTAEEAVNKPLLMGDRNGRVKGVVKDFHFQSIHHEITPLVLFPEGWYNIIMVKMNTANVDQTLAHIQKVWSEVAPHRPFKYNFLDEQFEKMYSTEKRTGTIILIFASIAIALASLGLFGLSSYSIIIRAKEIGIRKVLGSSISNIVGILSKDFIKMVFVASLLAIPLAWFAMNTWLSDFSYRIKLEWWMFALSAIVAILIAFLTIAMQSVKAAMAKPVNSLRDE